MAINDKINITAAEVEEDIKSKEEKLKKQAAIKKKEKEASVPVKQYFTIVLEATVPVTLSYRVLADDAEDALNLMQRSPMTGMSAAPKLTLPRIKKHKAKVYQSGTTTIKLVKNY
jgi:hypothetical protein